ncbi:MAG TPA: hypothetical protein VM285_07715 [Polyangia bacterium]|nr:hypothetical protein [Polyangia bacterium]
MSPAGTRLFPKWRWTGLALPLLCCCSAQVPGSLPPAAPDLGPEPAPAPEPPAAAPPAAAPEPPTPEEEPGTPTYEEALECRKRHCYPPASKCFQACYKYNHPNGPVHDDCNDGCRRTYDVANCEAACARDRLAFEPIPSTVPGKCRKRMAGCRRDCDPARNGSCELRCLHDLRICESEETPD